jgi:peptide/nickel transport system substrate-binding protein
VKSKILLISLVAVLALSLGLVGCTEEVPPETPETPKSITIAYPGGFFGGLASVDPCDFFYAGPDNPNIFEPLIGQDADEALIPLLAESWSWSSDGLTLTVNLQDDVVFSSGDPFTSADVIFSFDRHRQYNMPAIAQFSPEQGFDRYEADGDYTVKFYFTKKNVQFVPQTLAMNAMISKAYYDRVGEDDYKALPVGTGPYKIDNWESDVSIDVVYNELYRGDKPEIESATFLVYSSPENGVAMLEAGEADLLSQAPGSSITELEGLGYNNIPVVMFHALALVFNLVGDGDQPWDHLEVRQAINYAINKDQIKGSLICGPIQDGTWVLPLSPWYDAYADKGLDPSYDYDLSTARDLMAAAGYAAGFDFPLCYLATETVTPLAEYLTSALAEININVELDGIAGMPDFMGAIGGIHYAYFGGEATPASPGAFLYDPGWPGNPEVAIDLTNGFYSGKDNTLFDDGAIDALVDQVLSELDDSTRYGLAADAWELIDDLLPAIPVGQEVQTNFSIPTVVYIKSIGGMMQGPRQLVDLRIVD